MPTRFTQVQPTLENYWRSIILFGQNAAAYKFALGKSLLELSKSKGKLVTLEELAEPFARNVCKHLQKADKQGTSRSSKFLDQCRRFNSGDIGKDELHAAAERWGFVNVIDAFHVVNNGQIDVRFFSDERQTQNGIILTDELFRLAEKYQARNLPQEIEARWRLVETAWELNVPSHVLTVRYDPLDEMLITDERRFERKPIAGCRDALNGYQKGKCFYCAGDISVAHGDERLADVDHFFPHVLKRKIQESADLDGVWNLVLACQDCNRGPEGKFAHVPALQYLARLHKRNSFFIESHHPLRETLMKQTGLTDASRIACLQSVYATAKELLIHEWKPDNEHEDAF